MSEKRTRSRFGCHRCKKLKIKCDELKPTCSLCEKANSQCDYSIKLTWGGRPFKKQKSDNLANGTITTFQKKYNKGDTPVIIQQQIAPNIEIKIHDPANPQQKKKSKKKTVKAQLITPSPSEEKEEILSLEDATSSVIQNADLELLKAFEELKTPNLSLKSFVNDIILPDLSNGFNDNVDPLSSSSQNHNGLSISLLGDNESPPEDLVFMENFISNPTTSSSSISFAIPEITTGFEYIMPSISPLPDLLLQNDYYRQHYHSYIEVFSRILCPAPPQSYTDNPFTCILPQMSLSSKTDGLLSLLIAASVSQSFRLNNDPFPHEIISELTSRAFKDLYNRLIDPVEANSDYTLALVLLLSVFELICTGKRTVNGWKAHYYGAKKIIFSKGYLKIDDHEISEDSNSLLKVVELPTGKESDLSFFFTRWFAYMDVIGSLTSSNVFIHDNANKKFAHNEVLIWKGPLPTMKDREQLKDIDPFMGFDLKLLEFFSEIGNIAKECALKSNVDGIMVNPNIDVNLVQRALELKEIFLGYLDKTELERDEVLERLKDVPSLKPLIQDYGILRATNKVFAWAGVLQIYRRILKLPKDSPLVQTMIQSITQLIKLKIPSNATAAYCTTFSLLSAGCDTSDIEDREFYLRRFRTLLHNGLNSAKVAMDVMVDSWKSDKYWADVLADKDIDMVFV